MGIETMGKIIAGLRKKKGMTQEQLAASLLVTDKAVSKWETGGGYPDISLLPKIAEIFGVTIDLLMTGKDPDPQPISKLELCAKQDDLVLYAELKTENKVFSARDENQKSLLDYIIQYRSPKVFGKIIEWPDFDKYAERKRTEILQTAILTNNAVYLERYRDAISRRSSKPDPLLVKPEIAKETADMILSDQVSDATREIFFSRRNDKLPHYLYAFLFTSAIEHDQFDIAMQLAERAKTHNDLVRTMMREIEKKQATTGNIVDIQDGIVVTRYSGGKYLGNFVAVPPSAITACLEKGRFELATKLNEINLTAISNRFVPEPSAFSQNVFEEYRIKQNKSLSESEKRKSLVMVGGYLDIAKLIAYDDIRLFREMIDQPAYPEERLYDALQHQDYRSLLKIALDLQGKYPWLPDAAMMMDPERILHPHKSVKPPLPSLESLSQKKRQMTFQQIIKHKSVEFFELACETDSRHLDWALAQVDPSRLDIIKVLLDHGAQLHKSEIYDDDEGQRSIDTIDKIGTEVLKRQINDLLGVKKP